MRRIDSKDNPLYKKLLGRSRASFARKHRLVTVEGIRHTEDLAFSGRLPDYLFFSDDEKGKKAMDRLLVSGGAFGGIFEDDRLILLDSGLFARACGQDSPAGVMALLELQLPSLEEWLEGAGKKAASLLVLEEVQDPGNVGTLIRTADAFGYDGVLLLTGSASVWNPKTAASAAGSLFHLPVMEAEEEIGPALARLKKAGFILIAADLGGESLDRGDWPRGRRALLLGNEGRGLSPDTLAASDLKRAIPMGGRAQSLNVASAGAILMWADFQRTGEDTQDMESPQGM